jgi:putative nucleotidyltransferase with HDIG domain
MSELDDLAKLLQELEIENRNLKMAHSDLERSYDVRLESMGDVLDLKQGTNQHHCKRVTAYTIAIARAMGVAKDQIGIIARGAFLHDIGKMGISEEILRKPSHHF